MAFSRTVAHATSADGTFSSAGATAWNGTSAHTPAVAGATSGGIPYFDSTTSEASSGLLAANALLIGGGAGAAPFTSSSLTWGPTAGQGFTAALGTATTDVGNRYTQTWNAAGVAFTYEKHVITDTASAAGSLALQYLGGAAGTTNLFNIGKLGDVNLILSSLSGSAGALTARALQAYGSAEISVFQTTTYNRQAGLITSTGLGGFVAGLGLATGSVISWDDNANLGAGTVRSGISQISNGILGIGTGAAGSFAGGLKLTDLTINRAATFLTTSVALTDGAGAGGGTLLNAPAAGNPTKWIGINDNGTTRYIPAW